MSLQHGIFITGTDTGVGKTQVGAALARALSSPLGQSGRTLRVRKPIESGATATTNGLLAEDANTLKQAAQSSETLRQICPYPLAAVTSPQRAAELEGKTYNVAQLHQACMASVSKHDFLQVEGAGGFLSPLCDDGLNADLAQQLGLPVLLVVADRLGCINHTLLTIEALTARGLQVQAIALNLCQPLLPGGHDNAAELSRYCEQPLIKLPASDHSPAWHRLAEDSGIASLAELIISSH